MTKEEALSKYFSDIKGFRDVQGQTIDSILEDHKTLCLMPTGGGKSLIFQIAGLCLQKTVLVVSPLVALMEQQNQKLLEKGIKTAHFSGMDYKKQFRTITDMANGKMPQFIFSSPERIHTDGYLEYVLNKRRNDIGLVVVDEVHCVSQWGDGFRPSYKTIPSFLDRVFGDNNWPALLCLTATLNEEQQKEVVDNFKITKVIKGEKLWRDNLHLEIINLKDGKEDTKDKELERIIEKHKGEKILVFAHRVYGKHPTTRTLYEKYKDVFDGVAFFDAGAGDKYKGDVLKGFEDGSVKIVFATSAFGMGVDISDIRVVVNYLISETTEQYYQEVGRGGRDGLPAYGYLLYTNQSKRGRKMLLNQSLCNESVLVETYEDRKPKDGETFSHMSYEDMNEDQRVAFSLLLEFGVFSIVSKGVSSLRCFSPTSAQSKEYIESLSTFSRIGSVKTISKRSGTDINSLTLKLWELCSNGKLELVRAPDKSIFYVQNCELSEELKKKILDNQDLKKAKRTASFDEFVNSIEAGMTAEQIIKQALDI